MKDNPFKNNEGLIKLLVESGSDNFEQAMAAQSKIAMALAEPLRKGVLVGDITEGIFEATVFQKGAAPKYILDILAPGEEGQHVAYTIPKTGYIPHRAVEGDYVQLPTYRIGNSIDWPLFLARDARYDVLGRCMEIFYAGVVKKVNDDAFHTLLAAATDRNILVYDGDATAGQLTKRLISMLKVTVVRNGGGNTGSIRRSRLTDVFCSHECVEDIRNWGYDQIDEITRRELYTGGDDMVTKIFGVKLRPLDEFGEDSEYQSYYTNTLSGTMASSDVEILLGLDLTSNDSFVMPIVEELQVFSDPTLHRSQQAGVYGWMEMGLGVLDGRRVILASI